MTGAKRRNGSNLENQFPGCTGRMVNLFDLNSGIHSNKLITDGPHDDDSLRLRSRSDVGTASRLSVQRRGTDDNLSPRNRKESRIPGKMLSKEDMSKKVELKNNPPNLVAKLMGLDALPLHQSGSAVPKFHAREFSSLKVEDSATIRRMIEEEDGSSKKIMQRQMTQILSRSVREEYKDTHENWQKVTDSNQSSPVDCYNGTVDGKQMSFVRQKFMEAKCLATDEKLRQSKEFHDALEFLSSNRDLFVRFLQEPNLLLSKNLSEFYPVPPSPGTKRITILRPSKIDNFRGSGRRSEKSSKKPARVEQTYFPAIRNQRNDELTFQPTRIVVLKPNNGKIHGIKRVVSPPCSSPGIIHGEQSSNEPENDKTEEFRRLAGEITDKIRANLTGNRVNKISRTTVFSNGCSGDDSSFNKSENEYAVEKSSDSEFMSPSSSHSWSYVKSCGGPFLPSSFSRILCSPESSLSKEAKKRLSERWAMIASHGNAQEQRGVRRNSNTLREMLALSETKKSVGDEDESRKQSIPEFSTMCNSRIKIEEGSEEIMEKNDKSSLRGKVSSLFFSRNKKQSKDADNTLHKDEIPESIAHHAESRTFSGSTSNEIRLETCLCSSFSAGTSSDSIKMRHQRGIISREKGSARLKSMDPANLTLSRHQPGPTSVLDPPFDFQQSVKSIIDKSPPIESIARTLLRDGSSCSCTSPGPSFHASSVSTRKEEERNFLLYVQTLLTMARLESNSFTLRWHSLENPLDPSLRDKYANLDSKERDHEAKRRKLRSNRILVFDSVITALLEVSDYGSDWNRKTISNCRSRNMSVELLPLSMDRVLAKMKEWFNCEVRFAVDEGEDSGSQVVESVVRKKVVGREWVEHLKMETGNLGRKIEERLMEEMVEEAVIEFANDI